MLRFKMLETTLTNCDVVISEPQKVEESSFSSILQSSSSSVHSVSVKPEATPLGDSQRKLLPAQVDAVGEEQVCFGMVGTCALKQRSNLFI